MAQAYSDDLRQRVVDAVEAGCLVRAVARRFEVAVSSVVKWHQLYRRTGSVRPMPRVSRRSVLDGERDYIVSRIEAEPHITLHRLKDELAERGVKVSHNAVWLFLRREGMTHKKRHARAGAITR